MREGAAYRQMGKDEMFKVWHASSQSLILYIHSDGGSIVSAEKTYPIQKGALCFIGKGKYHYTMPKNSEEYERSKLFLSPMRQSRLVGATADTAAFRAFGDGAFVYAVIPEEERDDVLRIYDSAIRAATDERCGEALLLAAAIELLGYLDRYAVDTVSRSEGFMDRAVEYINENLIDDLTVDKICLAAHVSKYHFCRCFKQTMGITVMDYVLKTRLTAAKKLLREDALSVTEIGTRCGFSSPAYFSRVFKAEAGVSPLRYRKQRKGE